MDDHGGNRADFVILARHGRRVGQFGSWVSDCHPFRIAIAVGVLQSDDRPRDAKALAQWDGKNPAIDGVDRDAFTGAAVWSGTSFTAPLVIASLVREMRRGPCSAAESVRRVIDAPHLGRLPGLGTVVAI